MNCAIHPEQTAVAFCRSCGKALCETCQRPAHGTIFCEEHLPVPYQDPPPAPPPYASPYTAPPGATPYPSPYAAEPGVSPGLAFVLGLIPGVGAIYNGQYAKGVVHAVIFGLLVSIQSSGAAGGLEPLFGILTGLFFFYQAFEAYHTAQKRQRGEAVDEFSSIFPLGSRGAARGFPVGPVIIILIGIVFLLNTLEVVRLYQILRYWPLFLIALGAWMLWVRLSDRDTSAPPEVRGE